MENPEVKRDYNIRKTLRLRSLFNFGMASVLFAFVFHFFVFIANVNVYDNFHYTVWD